MRSSFLAAVLSSSALLARAAPVHRVEVQAHRGGLGLRPESTAFAFAYALEIGADVLEMDTVFTKDGIPVIWHDHRVDPKKCKDTTGSFVGKYIANLTLAEVKTLDCGSQQAAGHIQQLTVPGAQIQSLEEVLELVDCYGDRTVTLNLETKLDPLAPNETLPVSTYVNDLVPILKKRGFDKRTVIQSFDWRTLTGIKKKFPSTKTVALLDDTTITDEDGRGIGGYPWLGGINLEKDFKGDWVKAAKSIGASIVSPVHGIASGQSVNTPGYKPFVTKENTDRAHKLGLQMIPWTVDDESTIEKLMNDGVDAIISNYPERVKFVARENRISSGKKPVRPKTQCLKSAALKV